MSRMKLDWDKWLYGLGSGVIGGGSGAVVAGLSAMLLAPQEFNVTSWHGVIKALSMMTACFVINGFIAMFFYLKQSPLPPVETETVETVRQSSDARGTTMSEASKTVTTTPVTQTAEIKLDDLAAILAEKGLDKRPTGK